MKCVSLVMIIGMISGLFSGRQEVSPSDLLTSNGYYYQMLPTPLNSLTTGEVLALPFKRADQITSARVVTGKLPEGTALYANGLLTVTDAALLAQGQHRVVIETLDQTNTREKTEIVLTFLGPTSPTDEDAMYKMSSEQDLARLNKGDLMAYALDPDGQIVQALCVMGDLPPGSELTADGKLLVKDSSLFVAGDYAAGIVTVDERGGTTFFIISLPIQAQ